MDEVITIPTSNYSNAWMKRRTKSLSRDIARQMKILKADVPSTPIPSPKLQMFVTQGLGSKWDVEFRRVNDEIHISFDPLFAADQYKNLWEPLITFYYWFANSNEDARVILANMSDGERPGSGKFAISSYRDDVTTLPDPHYFYSRGYKDIEELLARQPTKWRERSDDIVWRGSSFGNGYPTFDVEMAENPAVLQRIRLAHLAKGSVVDFKFVPHSLTSAMHVPMVNAGLMGARIDEETWINRKYAIDIDGYSNAWSNFFIRLKLGCCVLKVESQFGFRQWYYHKLKPFVHYVPVKADLSDLFEQVEWVKTHQAEAEMIAKAGQAVANEMTFEYVLNEATSLIEENWNR